MLALHRIYFCHPLKYRHISAVISTHLALRSAPDRQSIPVIQLRWHFCAFHCWSLKDACVDVIVIAGQLKWMKNPLLLLLLLNVGQEKQLEKLKTYKGFSQFQFKSEK
jgi:hypothetical protein